MATIYFADLKAGLCSSTVGLLRLWEARNVYALPRCKGYSVRKNYDHGRFKLF